MERYARSLLFVFLSAGFAGSVSATTLFESEGSTFSLNTFNGSGAIVNNSGPPGGFDFPTGIALGPDGNVYVGNQSSGSEGEVYKFDTQGNLIGSFVGFGGGGLQTPTGLTFGPDGNLYVADLQGNSVDEFNGATGASIATVIPGSSALTSPEDLVFGPDGNLYITDAFGVEKWDGSSLTSFALINGSAIGLAFGSDGNLYVADSTNGVIRVFNSAGTDVRDFGFANLDQPIGLAFGPDGLLYVATGTDPGTGNGAAIVQFDPSTGAFVGDFASSVSTSNGLVNPQFIAFAPEPSTMLLGALGLAAIAATRVKRRRS